MPEQPTSWGVYLLGKGEQKEQAGTLAGRHLHRYEACPVVQLRGVTVIQSKAQNDRQDVWLDNT